jgi:hypothetical protein
LTTKIEFYDQLREHLPEPAARLIAEEMRLETDLATRADVGATHLAVEGLRSSMFRWMLLFFAPLWIGVYATLVAILLKGP